eukprot:6203045-Pleurochrysis_carterae.AAC.4
MSTVALENEHSCSQNRKFMADTVTLKFKREFIACGLRLREWVSRPAAAAASGGVSSCTRGARRACTELSSVAAENAAEASLAAVSAVAAGCGCASSAERSEGAQVLSVWPSDAGEVPPRVSGINTSTPAPRILRCRPSDMRVLCGKTLERTRSGFSQNF